MKRFILLGSLLIWAITAPALSETKWIITKCGMGTLPADSLTALAMAVVKGADSVQIGTVLSQDDEVIVLSDTLLNQATNVAEVFPERQRTDGNYQALDFTVAELRQLTLVTPGDPDPAVNGLKYPIPPFHISTLDEALGLIRMLEKRLGKQVSIVFELRKSWFHQREGRDLSTGVVNTMRRFGYTSAESGASIGSYDPEELRRIKDVLLPAATMDAGLIQLVSDNSGSEHMSEERGRLRPYNYDWTFTKFGLKAVSSYANAIGLAPHFFSTDSESEMRSSYLEDARLLGLRIIVYPVDFPAGSATQLTDNSEELVDQYLLEVGLDGLLTSDDAHVRAYLLMRSEEESRLSEQQRSIDRLIESVKGTNKPENVLFKQENPLQ